MSRLDDEVYALANAKRVREALPAPWYDTGRGIFEGDRRTVADLVERCGGRLCKYEVEDALKKLQQLGEVRHDERGWYRYSWSRVVASAAGGAP